MFENIINFFKKIGKADKDQVKSKDAAKERLHLVLMQDRANVSADFLDLMKQEIIEVIKKYIDVDENAIDVRLTNKANNDGTTGAPALYANIPIVSIKDEIKDKIVRDKKVEKKSTKDKEQKVETSDNTESNISDDSVDNEKEDNKKDISKTKKDKPENKKETDSTTEDKKTKSNQEKNTEDKVAKKDETIETIENIEKDEKTAENK